MSLSQVGSEIKRVRQLAKLSQAALGKKCGVTNTYICHLEHGRKCPSIELLMRIAFKTGHRIHLVIGAAP